MHYEFVEHPASNNAMYIQLNFDHFRLTLMHQNKPSDQLNNCHLAIQGH